MAKIIKTYSRKTCALVLAASMLGFYFSLIDRSDAAQISNRRDTMNNSAQEDAGAYAGALVATSNHEIVFTLAAGASEGNSLDTVGWNDGSSYSASDTIVIKFDDPTDGFDFSNLRCDDVDLRFGDYPGTATAISANANGGSRATRTVCPGSATSWGLWINSTDDEITFYTPTNVQTHVASGTQVIIAIGSNAVDQETGNNWISNPTTAGGKAVDVSGTFGGTGRMYVYIIQAVQLSATIAETLSFAISGLPGIAFAASQSSVVGCKTTNLTNGQDDDDNLAVNFVTTTATSVPFGNPISVNATYQGCQRLEVTTNAAGGYTITQRADTPMKTTGGSIISNMTGDTGAATPYVADAFAVAGTGLGLSCRDAVSAGAATSQICTATKISGPNFNNGINWVPFATESLGFTSSTRFAGISDATSVNVLVKAKYRLRVPGNQGAGTYTNNVSWIVTPTYN